MKLYDPHIHINTEPLLSKYKEVYNQARENGVEAMICVGLDKESSIIAIEQTKELERLYSAIGYHPCDVDKFCDEDFGELISLMDEKTVAIGEIGLDYYHDDLQKELQKEVFIKQVEKAIELDMPVIIHSREATEDMIEILTPYAGKLKGLFHCFPGGEHFAKWIVNDMKMSLALCGNVTFKNCDIIHDLKEISVEKIVVETDSPYLSPVPKRGKENSPENVKFILEFLANYKGINSKELSEIIDNNIKKLFNVNI